MKTEIEIQRAHDILAGIVDGQVQVEMDARSEMGMRGALDALCWVLEHIHNKTFETNLGRIEDLLERRGIVLKQRPEAE